VAIYFWQDTGPELLVMSLIQDLLILGVIILLGKNILSNEKKKLFKKYNRFFQLFQKAPNPVWEIQLPDLKILEINDAAIKRYGYKGHKVNGRSITDLFSKDDRINFEASLLSANQTGYKSLGIFLHNSFYGESFHVKLLANLYEEDGIRRCFIVAYDVEQEVIQNAEITFSRDYLERVLESIGNGMMIVDEHLNIIRVNKAYTEFINIEAEKILKKPVSQAIPSWKKAGITDKIESVLKTKISIREEFLDPDRDKWFRIAMFYFEKGVSIFILDITEQRNKIEDRYIDEKTLASLISYSSDAIFFVDREKRLRFFNHAFESWYLKFVGTVPEKNSLLFQEEHMGVFLEQWDLRFEKAIAGQSLSIYERIPDPVNQDEQMFFHSIYNPLLDENGDFLGVGAFARNLTDLKNNEQILNQLNNRLNNTLQQIINGFISVNAEMIILDVNPTIEKMLEVSKSDVIGKPITELLRINTVAFQEFNLQECLESKIRKEGVLHLEYLGIWMEYIAYPEPFEQIIDIYFNDITKRKNIENELIDSLKKYELVAKVSNDIIWEWEFDTDNIDWSHGLKEFLGYELQTGEGHFEWWKEKIHVEDRDRVLRIIHETIQNNGSSWNFEYKFADSANKYHHIIERGFVHRDKSGKPVKAIGTMQDTEPIYEKQQEIEQLYYILSKAEASVIITDANKQITWVNDGFTKMTGYTLKEVAGKKPGSILQGADTDGDTILEIKENLNHGKTVTTQLLNYNKNKEPYWNRMVITPIFKNGEINSYIAVQFDVTQEVRNSIHIQQQNEKLREIAYISAHKLRGPVSSILGLAQVLELEPENQETHHKIIEYIMESSERLDKEIYKIIAKTGEIED
jgi:PAS domain S-box-containing protein